MDTPKCWSVCPERLCFRRCVTLCDKVTSSGSALPKGPGAQSTGESVGRIPGDGPTHWHLKAWDAHRHGIPTMHLSTMTPCAHIPGSLGFFLMTTTPSGPLFLCSWSRFHFLAVIGGEGRDALSDFTTSSGAQMIRFKVCVHVFVFMCVRVCVCVYANR